MVKYKVGIKRQRLVLTMYNSLNDTFTLNNGVKMPVMGLGVWKVKDGAEVKSAIEYAVKAGYRSIDTAAAYGNEEGVGDGIKSCGVSRDELFYNNEGVERRSGL